MPTQNPAYVYPEPILAALALHGLRPLPHTPPALLRGAVLDLYRYELVRLRGRLLAGEFPRSEYAPRVIKQSLVGRGAADKEQVQHMVRLLLNLPGMKLQADAADALAIALTHAHMSATAARTGLSTALLRRRGA